MPSRPAADGISVTWRQRSGGRVQFSIDQPSSKFATFGHPRIATVGAQLDAKVAELLRLMSLPVPPELIAE